MASAIQPPLFQPVDPFIPASDPAHPVVGEKTRQRLDILNIRGPAAVFRAANTV